MVQCSITLQLCKRSIAYEHTLNKQKITFITNIVNEGWILHHMLHNYGNR